MRFKRIKKVFASEEWGIAYRKKQTGSFNADSFKGEYIPLKNNLKYWFADPLAIGGTDGKPLLFVEAFSRRRDRGEIGVIPFSDRGPQKYIPLIREQFHMSYPFIFKKDDRWYMIPETNQAKQLILYAADDFPFRWKRYKALLDGKECVDTNVVDIDSTLFLITYEKGTPNELVIYKIENGFNLKKQNEIKDSDNQRRGAGKSNRKIKRFFGRK